MLVALCCAEGLPARPQASPQAACPNIVAPRPTVAPRQTYKANAMVPAYELDEKLQWTECAAPEYPAGVSGDRARNRALLFITVDEEGNVTDIKARGGSIDPEGFFDAAVAAVRRWRTSAPRWKALPVKTSFAADIVFTPPGSAPPPGEAAPAVAPAQPVAGPPASTASAEPPKPAATRLPGAATTVAEPAPAAPAPGAASAPSPVSPPPAAASPALRVMERAPTAPSQTDTPFAVEYYYKVKWGFADEFWRLFQKNHWPVLKQQMDTGRILRVTADRPRYHATEDGRWDFRVTIVFRGSAAAFEAVDTAALERRLFPDQEAFRREEQRRFEILLAHWDVPVVPQSLAP
jgi:TonB family protein